MSRHEISVVLGRRGSGKSVLARHLVADCPRLLVWNTLGEKGHNSLGEVYRDKQDLFNAIQAFQDDAGRVSCQFVADIRADDPAENQKTFEWFLLLARRVGEYSEGVTILVDEVDMYCSPHSVPMGLDWLCRYGRHAGVSMVCCSRRPAEMPRILTSQASHLYVFRTSEPTDVAHIRAATGGDVSCLSLGDYEYAHYRL